MFSSVSRIVRLSVAMIACIFSLLPSSTLQILDTEEHSVLRTAHLEESSNIAATPVDGLSCSVQYGNFQPVDVDSCTNALEKIPQTADPHTYIRRHRGARPTPSGNIPLPIRYLSDDGICAIDVMLAPVS